MVGEVTRHTWREEGGVDRGDMQFGDKFYEDVQVSKLKPVRERSHGHAPKKKKKREGMTITKARLKEIRADELQKLKEAKVEKLKGPENRKPKERMIAEMKKLRIPVAGPKKTDGYTCTQKGNKGVLAIPSKHFDNVIEVLIKLNIPVHVI